MMDAEKPQCLIFDLEATPATEGQPARIFKLGALRPDSGAELELRINHPGELSDARHELDTLARDADCLLGHNIIAHDLPLLRESAPDLELLELPVIDTLRLSPLAFPQNPYHRLLKDYKLIRDSLNSPLADCHATLTLFRDQCAAFAQLLATQPDELLCYQTLLSSPTEPALTRLFTALTGQSADLLIRAQKRLPVLLAETDASLDRDLKVCRTRLQTLLTQDLRRSSLHWPLAYALAWLRISGGNSVLAPWLRYQFPDVGRLLHELRDMPCDDSACQYCQTTHDPRHELQQYFGFDDFLYEQRGQSLQHDTVLAGMRSEHVLAVLPTGGGKSLCYQLPALNRYHRDASLTVIVSPLQSLMKDQVDGLLARNVQCAATLNGMLTMPERTDVLDGIRMGDVGVLLVSPEQFRNNGFRRAIGQRRVGAWIFDEAHCLSKWGNDFRPDYLYVARFIREYTGDGELAPIGGFTATAKPDVLADIETHFRNELDITFARFLGTPERTNLSFDVLECGAGEKWPTAHRLLQEHLGQDAGDNGGGAIVFVASRKKAEDAAEFLHEQGWHCEHFHAGLQPNEKKDIQDAFKAGELRVITATNAFGMGVDKADVRLVVHANIPGSLENYLQEAGRAGRDRAAARCILLYDPQDIETQFGLCEKSRIDWRDIKQILRKIRTESARLQDETLVITAGEILLDDRVDISFTLDDRDAETKVITAVAWLERGGFLQREENRTRIFPARLQLPREQAELKLKDAQLPQRRRAEYAAILKYLYAADPDERINTDDLMALTGLDARGVSITLKQMEELGLLVNDAQITLYLRHGTQDSSAQRLAACLQREKVLFDVLRELAPDADQGDWQDLNLALLTTQMKQVGALTDLRPDQVLRLLRSLGADAAAHAYRNSFDLKPINRELIKLRLRNGASWQQLEDLGQRRRDIAGTLLPFVIAKLPPGARGKDLLVKTTFGELQAVIDGDLELSTRIPDAQRRKAIEHVLLYLHKQEVLALNHGMTVMRRAMTIELDGQRSRPYRKSDYTNLDEHYGEKRIQVHIIREYAETALDNMARALQLVLDYFADPRDTFLQHYFAGRKQVLQLATSEQSLHAIIKPLNDTQKRAVTDDRDHNRLILAGPGSGKTRVIVHRLAYLLRVRRVAPASIIALAFNRHAANAIRSRLTALVGNDAFGVSILTYHRMAMRLTGTRFDKRTQLTAGTLEQVMADAVALLEGNGDIQHDKDDDLRARLLRGYRYILVDEYQDIDELQYRLVSALAGRHADEDGRLCIMAVGDDDQNIYAWRHTSNRYIEQFQHDYDAETDYLIDNYRSSAAIIAAADTVIAENPARLKRAHPIRIDAARQDASAGGRWDTLDNLRRGQVLRIRIDASDRQHGNLQVQASMAELERLLTLEQGSWDGCAVLARTHRYLQPLQAWCEHHNVPYFLAADRDGELPLTRQRSFVALIDALHAIGQTTPQALRDTLADHVADQDWQDFFTTALTQLAGEVGDCMLAGAYIINWLYDYAQELRQQPQPGLYLGTVHAAKGREFRHVVLLDGDWRGDAHHAIDERRLYYVGMSRARETLTLCEFTPGLPFAAALTDNTPEHAFRGQPLSALATRYQRLSLRDINLGYAGRRAATHPIHAATAALQVGDPLQLQADGDCLVLLDPSGQPVGRTARAFTPQFQPQQCRVAAILTRYADDGEPEYRRQLKCERWQIVVPLLIGQP